jgi:signal peptide peptidase SppA
MNYPKLLSEDVLLITPNAYATLAKAYEDLRSDVDGLAPMPLTKREGVDPWSGRDVPLDQMEMIDGIAVIPVTGPIGRGLNIWDKGLGATDVADIEDDIETAESDYQCRGILLVIDSPGGTVGGIPELADRILQVEKPIFAYTGGLACSAAYWIASATDGIFATKSADLGSIGVYCTFLDRSKMAADMGLKVQVFSSGKYKGAGVPGTSLTKEQAALVQDRIAAIAQMFFDHVTAMRPDVTAELMQGQTFKADAALALGLIDDVVTNQDEALQLLTG